MAGKGMSTTLVIIVAAVVILVTALVLLTIFGGSITPIASLADAKNHCTTVGDASCKAVGQLPPTWSANTVSYNNNMVSCGSLCNSAQCSTDAQGVDFFLCQ